MDFFSGLDFSMAGSVAESTEQVSREPLYYGIQFNYHGPVYLQIDDGRRFSAEGAYAFLTYPGSFFRYGPEKNTRRHHNFVCAYGERINSYISGGLFDRQQENPLIRIANPERFLRTMHSLISMTATPGKTPPRAVLLFEDLLLQIQESRQIVEARTPVHAAAISQLAAEIHTSPEAAFNFDLEAEKLNITPTHFRRIFKSMCGMPPQQFLIHNRLRKAAQLLCSGDAPVKEVAYLSGWENVFYFSRLFKEQYQLSPGSYRREFLNTAGKSAVKDDRK